MRGPVRLSLKGVSMNRFPSKPFPYEDIVAMPHPVSSVHPPMSLSDRAAQFAPFAALTSYHDAVREAARFTDDRIEPDEDVKDLLDERLRQLQQNADRHPRITILYFLPDEKKAGGTYVSATGSLKKIDWYQHLILLQDRTSVPIENIIELSFLS